MKLYFSPGACSLSPHIVLAEGGFDYTAEKVDLRTKQTATGADFKAINPKGYVPALVLDSGELLTEGPAIVQHLADLKPEAGLAPRPGTIERARVNSWLVFVSSELHKQFSVLFTPTAPAEWKETVKGNILGRVAFLDGELAGKSYLTGDTFTIADAYLFTILRWTAYFAMDLAPYANVTAFMARMNARPAVKAALAAEA